MFTGLALGCVFLDTCQSQTPASARGSIVVAEAVHVEHAPKTDGTLDDPLWAQANPVTDFRQREPFEGKAPTEATEVRILYTRSEIYFGIKCTSASRTVIATQLRRDVVEPLPPA